MAYFFLRASAVLTASNEYKLNYYKPQDSRINEIQNLNTWFNVHATTVTEVPSSRLRVRGNGRFGHSLPSWYSAF